MLLRMRTATVAGYPKGPKVLKFSFISVESAKTREKKLAQYLHPD